MVAVIRTSEFATVTAACECEFATLQPRPARHYQDRSHIESPHRPAMLPAPRSSIPRYEYESRTAERHETSRATDESPHQASPLRRSSSLQVAGYLHLRLAPDRYLQRA